MRLETRVKALRLVLMFRLILYPTAGCVGFSVLSVRAEADSLAGGRAGASCFCWLEIAAPLARPAHVMGSPRDFLIVSVGAAVFVGCAFSGSPQRALCCIVSPACITNIHIQNR